MIDSIFRAIGAGLEIWNHHEKTKYQKKFYRLKKDYYEQANKPEKDRDYAVMDNIEHELELLVEAFESEIFKGKK